MKRGPQYKICKTLGDRIFSKCQTAKYASRVARKTTKGQAGGRRSFFGKSDYGKQLLEKQKVRLTYGINERQFSNYVKKARSSGGNVIAELYQFLESRLDNVVFRLGLAPTRAMARQLVSHGHIHVNGHAITVPSYQADTNDVIMIRTQSRGKGPFSQLGDSLKKYKTPSWLEYTMEKGEGRVLASPAAGQDVISYNLGSIIELYSR